MTKLSLIGKLYEEHISTLTKEQPILKKVYSKSDKDSDQISTSSTQISTQKCSSKGLFLFAKLSSLMCSEFAQNQGKIILTTSQISERLCEGNVISGRMVKHQLNFFEQAFPNIFSLRALKNKSYISIQIPTERNAKFIPIFALYDKNNELEADTTSYIVLSFLLNKAAFNFRAGDDFSVTHLQLNYITNKLKLTSKTVSSVIKKLKELNVILENNSEQNNDLYFSESVLEQYKKLINLQRSEKCFNLKKGTKKIKNSAKKFTTYKEKIKAKNLKISKQNSSAFENQKALDPRTITTREQKLIYQQNLQNLFASSTTTTQNHFPTGIPDYGINGYEKDGQPVGKRWSTIGAEKDGQP